MDRFITGMAGLLTAVAALYICGLIRQAPKEDGTRANIDQMKFFAAFILCSFDIRSMQPDGFGEIIIAAVVALIGFVLLFYLIYGVMSLLKISGEDVADRRSKAFWVNVAITVALNLLVSV